MRTYRTAGAVPGALAATAATAAKGATAAAVTMTAMAVMGAAVPAFAVTAAAPAGAPAPRPVCRTEIDGSTARVACRNETGRAARVQLHIECRRWWDIDVDAEPVALAPGKSVRLADRCWAEAREAWVSFPR